MKIKLITTVKLIAEAQLLALGILGYLTTSDSSYSFVVFFSSSLLLLEDKMPLSFLEVQGKLLLGFQFWFFEVAFLLYFTKCFEKNSIL